MNDTTKTEQAPAEAPPEDDVLGVTDLRIRPVRHPWRWTGAIVTLLVIAGLLYAFVTAKIVWADTFAYLFNPHMLYGLGMTLLMAVLAMILGTVLGLLAAVMRQSENLIIRWVATGYVWLFRAVPLLVQILIWFNLALIFPAIGIPGIGATPGDPAGILAVDTNDFMTPFTAALFGLGVGEGAFVAEIVRSGVTSIPVAQRLAGTALGLTRGQVFGRIVLPQAIRVMIPPYGSEFINMFKMTSLAYTIGYVELMSAASQIYHHNYEVIELLFTASIWYLVMVLLFSWAQWAIERKLNAPHGTEQRKGRRATAEAEARA